MGKSKLVFITMVTMFFCAGCANLEQLREKRQSGEDKVFDEATDDQQSIKSEKEQPLPTRESVAPVIPKVGLILGPGGAKAFAHAGVIKELLAANVPIDAIVGLEWGAVVGGIYAQSGKIHDLEWKLYRLERKDLPGNKIFSDQLDSQPTKHMAPFLERSFESRRLEDFAVNFSCPSMSIYNGSLNWQEQGLAIEAMLKCLAFPPMFKPTSSWVSALFSVEKAVESLRNQKMDIVILVNVLGLGDIMDKNVANAHPEAAVVWLEARRYLQRPVEGVTAVIQVPTRPYDLFNFDRRKELVKLGERSAQRWATENANKYGF